MCALAAVLALGACREDEQDRPTGFQPGVYQGQPDAPIDDATREALRDRTRLQGF